MFIVQCTAVPVRPAADDTGEQRGVGAQEELCPHRAH